MDITKNYDEWLKTQKFTDFISTDEVRDELIAEFEFLSFLSVKEYTLYKKMEELQRKWKQKETMFASFLSQDDLLHKDVKYVKSLLWKPKKHGDFEKIKPILINTNDKPYFSISNNITWRILREFTSSMINNSNISRNLYYIVVDDVSGKILGVIQITSDFMDLGPRDKWIGWNREEKTWSGKLNNSAIGSTIVPTQPLGYYYLGGKLLALLTCSKKIEEDWYKIYGDVLVNLTTTSLYGSFSQYNSLKYWKKIGKTDGSISYEPSKKLELKLLKWLWFNYPYDYWRFYIATRSNGMPLHRLHRQRCLNTIYKHFRVPKEKIRTSHQRGVYCCPLFENTPDFLRNEINENMLIRRFDNSIESLSELWKEKYASKRIKKFEDYNIDNLGDLFYDDLLFMNWREVCMKYM